MTAAVALRILDGEKAGDIKTPPTKFASPKFDWRQMQRWGISESDLPPGAKSISGNRPYGNGIRGKSRSFSQLFLCKPDLSRSCCVNIVGVNLPKCSHGSAWQNWPVLSASRPLAN